jgi:hypothetical protein
MFGYQRVAKAGREIASRNASKLFLHVETIFTYRRFLYVRAGHPSRAFKQWWYCAAPLISRF